MSSLSFRILSFPQSYIQAEKCPNFRFLIGKALRVWYPNWTFLHFHLSVFSSSLFDIIHLLKRYFHPFITGRLSRLTSISLLRVLRNELRFRRSIAEWFGINLLDFSPNQILVPWNSGPTDENFPSVRRSNKIITGSALGWQRYWNFLLFNTTD
jgi:hypothetical protein